MKKIFAANWKQNKTQKDVDSFFETLQSKKLHNTVDYVIATSTALLAHSVQKKEATQLSQIKIFSQDLSWKESGAYTGNDSILQLKEVQAAGSLIGHSECRQYLNESNLRCEEKIALCLKHNYEFIYCIGESLEARENGQTEEVLKEQLSAIIKQSTSLKNSQFQIVLAYEPVWAIGTGKTATPEQIQETHQFIKNEAEAAELTVKVLYGGSVKSANISEILKINSVDGVLVGGASLDAKDYSELNDAFTLL